MLPVLIGAAVLVAGAAAAGIILYRKNEGNSFRFPEMIIKQFKEEFQ